MYHITTIEQLTEVLDSIEPRERAKAMKKVKISEQELTSYVTWLPNGYTRNCLARTPEYEVILLCWDAHSKTPVHGHGGEDCWVYQVHGEVEEIRFGLDTGVLQETHRMTLTPGQLTYMNDRMGYHAIENRSDQRALTLHIYASPIDTCEVYNNKKDRFETKEMSYDTYVENELKSPVF